MKSKMLAVLALIVAAFGIWYFTPKHYEVTLEGVYYQLGNEQMAEKVKVHIDGKLRSHVTGKKSFRGTIDFTGNSVPKVPNDRSALEIMYDGENASPVYSGFRTINDQGAVTADGYIYGMFFANDDLTQFSINVLKNGDAKTWSPSDGFMIAAPAQNRQEALGLSHKLMDKYGYKLED
ncbi:hypothetical protein [Paenibacillus sp. NFR01]|uniref:hypothetical protein n=1 Tax=Paenibacillus sp. NFR01 TaxID=1566279 RepID=UPI0008ABB241|nr:hypothetical protein [Paenibacillus sp. NFR01]SEU19536.1 hypothetical protein SAMN03159358_3893 [Paenibacillus sp. NFR01]